MAWPDLVWLGLTNHNRAGLNWTNRKFVGFEKKIYLFLEAIASHVVTMSQTKSVSQSVTQSGFRDFTVPSHHTVHIDNAGHTIWGNYANNEDNTNHNDHRNNNAHYTNPENHTNHTTCVNHANNENQANYTIYADETTR